jgi:PTS system mannose-specific IIA component
VIGLLVAAHQNLGEALLRAAEGIVGPVEGAAALSLTYDEDPEKARARFEEAVRRLDDGSGVLILTDMFGGTPTNMSLPFLEEGKVEVLTGVNLPVLIKAQTARQELAVGELAAYLKEYGCRNIVLASEIWKTKRQAAV